MNDTSILPTTQETLTNAVLEAELLLSFAASHGINIEDNILSTIVRGKHLLEMAVPHQDSEATVAVVANANSALNSEPQEQSSDSMEAGVGPACSTAKLSAGAQRDADEIAFWKARSALAQTVQPVSAESLKQCVLPDTSSTSGRGWLARLLRLNRRATGTGVEAAIKKMQMRIIFPVLLLLVAQVYGLIGQKVVADLEPRMEKMHGYLNDRQKLLLAEKTDTNKEALATLDSQIELSQVEIEIRVEMLYKWNNGWGWVAVPFTLVAPNHVALNGKVDVVNDDERHHQFRAMVLQANFALEVMQNFLLPLLYGCLGASLFVLRALATDAKEYTFDTERRISYNLRIYMGTLCGLVIGWFIPDAKVHEAALSQYSLSIIGGYGVDIVFGLMDKIISTLSSHNRQGAN